MTTAHAWVVAGGEPFMLRRTRGASLRARLSQDYRIVRAEGQLRPVEGDDCRISLHAGGTRRPRAHLFQWHPTGLGALPYTHVHFGAAAAVGRPELDGVHIPIGHVALDVGVTAKRDRAPCATGLREIGEEPARRPVTETR